MNSFPVNTLISNLKNNLFFIYIINVFLILWILSEITRNGKILVMICEHIYAGLGLGK